MPESRISQITREHIRKTDAITRMTRPIHFIDHIFSIIEPQLLRIGNWSLQILRKPQGFFRGPARVVPWALKSILFHFFFRSQVLTLDELKALLTNLMREYPAFDYIIGLCPCRIGMKQFSTTLPNCTDIQINLHAGIYRQHHPTLYKSMDLPHLLKRLEDFDRCGLVHLVFGLCSKEGFELAICNCHSDVCFPLRTHMQTSMKLIPGFHTTHVDESKCLGKDKCPTFNECLKICPVKARKIDQDKKVFVKGDQCLGCRICFNLCKSNANQFLLRKKKIKRYIPYSLISSTE